MLGVKLPRAATQCASAPPQQQLSGHETSISFASSQALVVHRQLLRSPGKSNFGFTLLRLISHSNRFFFFFCSAIGSPSSEAFRSIFRHCLGSPLGGLFVFPTIQLRGSKILLPRRKLNSLGKNIRPLPPCLSLARTISLRTLSDFPLLTFWYFNDSPRNSFLTLLISQNRLSYGDPSGCEFIFSS